MEITIYHNPNCGTSRNTLALVRAQGHEPRIIEYLKTPLTRPQLVKLIKQTGAPLREIIRSKEEIFKELGLDNAIDTQLLDAMVAHPVLLNRPIVQIGDKARLCRPAEQVIEMLCEAS
jgi:arsenate reductase (glutaredoxin)